MIKIQTTFEIEPTRMYDLLVTGYESPYNSVELVEGDWEEAWRSGDKGEKNAFAEVSFVDKYEAEEEVFMTDAVLKEGLTQMAGTYPKHFEDFMNENEDAITGDVFIQCIMFGEVIYG